MGDQTCSPNWRFDPLRISIEGVQSIQFKHGGQIMAGKTKAERVAEYLKMIADPEELVESLPPDSMLESLEVAGLESTGGGLATHDKVRSGLEKIARGFDPSDEEAGQLEAIIIPDKRPAAFIRNGTYTISHKLWQHLEKPEFRKCIEAAIPSIGRVELPDNPSIPFGGTGFIVGDGLMMTNRHVANLFASGLGTRVQFKPDESAAIDFKREYGSEDSLAVRVEKVLMIHPHWDMALLKVSGLPVSVKPLNLTVRNPEELNKLEVVAIGYPAFDPRNSAAEQQTIFGGVFNVKRLLPGKLNGRQEYPSFRHTVSAMKHDCTTLGGASGSALIDVKTGEVVGLHFAGAYLESNYSVPMFELARDSRVVQAGLNFKGPVIPTTEWAAAWTIADRFGSESIGDPSPGDTTLVATTNGGAVVAGGRVGSGQVVTFTIPLNVTVSLGNLAAPASTAPASSGDAVVEKVPLIYPDLQKRKGYDPDFLKLSGDVTVPMPELTPKGLKLAAKLEDGTPHLKYHRFTVVVHKVRRLALFTAANVDWRPQSRLIDDRKPSRKELNGFDKDAAEDWVTDPRIPFDHQLPDYFYTKDGGAFDKGHLVRRDDVAWGKTFEEMQKGNGDTFHTTNCSPQTARFNQSKFKGFNWGELENMVEKQTSAEKVCTISGPVLDPEDKFFHGKIKSGVEVSIQIPSRFWKIIIANKGGKPQAFGFVLDQDLSEVDLHEELIVPEAWKKFMKPLKEIEEFFDGLATLGPILKWDQFKKA